ncbi:hypothetical protein AYO38_05330 [bacterium SCGC AG-212-C10]|nr:hypothetical protein AYO38_05330 [bacterium SCGC AG-212-C10]
MERPRIALCIEQTLGHRTHGMNLEEAVRRGGHHAVSIHVDFPDGGSSRVPWALRGSWDAFRQIRRRARSADVSMFHTQTISLFAPFATPRRPYVVSVDATPAQMDELGHWYQHDRHPGSVERGKSAWYRRVLGSAAAVVSWSKWAADSLAEDYGVPRERILVAHPGAPDSLFGIPRDEPPTRLPRILFVGGDFPRKGGPALLEAFAPLADRAELLIVTESEVEQAPGVHVVHGVRPGSDKFLKAFSGADIFCLPTLGDCTPVAIGEALAAGLPVVTTAVGSNHETVRDAETGLVVPAGNTAALGEALAALVDDPARRWRLGQAARADARERLNAAANADRVLELLGAVA